MTKRFLRTVLWSKKNRYWYQGKPCVNYQLVLLISNENWKLNVVSSSMGFVTFAETEPTFFLQIWRTDPPKQTNHTETDPTHRPANSGLALTESVSFTHSSLRIGWGLGKHHGRATAPLASPSFPLPAPQTGKCSFCATLPEYTASGSRLSAPAETVYRERNRRSEQTLTTLEVVWGSCWVETLTDK